MAVEGLDNEEREIAASVLDDVSIREIARQRERPYSTIRSIIHRPHVLAYIEQIRADAMEEVRRSKLRGAKVGMDVLREVATDKTAPHGARVQAAAKLTDVCIPREPVDVRVSGNPEAPIEHVHAGKIASGLSDEALALAVAQLEAREALRRLGVDAAEGSG